MWIKFLIFLTFPQIAYAYVGPALGIGAIILLVLFCLAGFILLFSIIYYPIKYIKKKFKKFNEK